MSKEQVTEQNRDDIMARMSSALGAYWDRVVSYNGGDLDLAFEWAICPLSGFGENSPHDLVASGYANDVCEELDRLEAGGFA